MSTRAQTTTLQHWTFSNNNTDSAALRSPGLTASVPTFSSGFNVASGSTLLPYSPDHGMAYGPNTGLWTVASGGPGGNLNRNFYVQFTISANSNYNVHVDSISFYSAFVNSSSNTKLAIVSSSSNFTLYSSSVTGGIGIGAPLAGTANGAFTTPIVLNQAAVPTNFYTLALNGATGVNIPAGQSIQIRFYNSCGSATTNRYAMLKNVSVIGTITSVGSPLPVDIIQFSSAEKNGYREVTWSTGMETNIDHYELEQSKDGRVFQRIASIRSNNTNGSVYTVKTDATTNSTYYRLKVVNLVSGFSYSKIIHHLGESMSAVNLFPNPTKESIHIAYPEQLQGNKVCLYNSYGMCVQQCVLKNAYSTTIDLSRLASGLYHIQIKNGELKTCYSFIKE